MALLPLLCEECSSTSLLLGGGGSVIDNDGSSTNDEYESNGIFTMIKLVLDCTVSSNIFGGGGKVISKTTTTPKTEDNGCCTTTTSSGYNKGGACIFFDHIFNQTKNKSIGVQKEDLNIDNSNNNKMKYASMNDDDDSFTDAGSDETLLSISSLVLSLLIAVLELGSKHRLNKAGEEEGGNILQSLMPTLESLSKYTDDNNNVSSSRTSGSTTSSSEANSSNITSSQVSSSVVVVARAELAEMSSHAMALISSLSITSSTEHTASQPTSILVEPSLQKEDDRSSRRHYLNDKIRQAEKDLKSNQPPIRARGVVTLRHLARGSLVLGLLNDDEVTTFRNNKSKSSPLIEEIDDVKNNSNKGRKRNDDGEEQSIDDIDYVIFHILRLSVMSLSDSESYVYLAGIQTIVSVGDVCPRNVLPSIGHAVGTGINTWWGGGHDDDSSSQQKSLEVVAEDHHCLSPNQRVKLAEALLFTIRRRGEAIYEYVQLLMDLMLFGKHNNKQVNSDDSDVPPTAKNEDVHQYAIQRQTHDYFVKGNRKAGEGDETDNEDLLVEERRLRLNTGGPVFDSEEDDAVRAACISVAAELVSVSHPSYIQRYCSTLVRLAINAFRLDQSRPIRRSAALLCRELYGSVLREYDELLDIVHKNERFDENSILSLSVEIVSCDEEEVLITLMKEQIATRSDNSICFDQATIARCEEALDNRREAERVGILAAAKLIATSTKLGDKNRVTRIIQKRLKAKSSRSNKESNGYDDEIVSVMKSLRIDSEKLTLI